MDLNEFRIAVFRAGLKRAADGAAGADHRHGRFAEHQSAATAGQDHRVSGKGADLHADQILTDATAADARIVQDRPQKVPELVFSDVPLRLPAADLFVQCVQQLLARRRSGEGRPFVHRAAEPPSIQVALLRAIERHAQAVHQIDDLRPPVRHLIDGRLVLQKVAAVHGVVKVLPLAVARLPRQIVARIDAALGTHAVRTLDGRQTHQVHVDAQFGQPHGGG